MGIVRTLTQASELFLVEEPTASLHHKISREIMRLMIELAKKWELSAVITIHDVLLAPQLAQRMIRPCAGEGSCSMVARGDNPEGCRGGATAMRTGRRQFAASRTWMKATTLHPGRQGHWRSPPQSDGRLPGLARR
ncbi:MAG: hypothetical protein RML45_16045 [Acetobacteraceae bacterium]|nr:hypothetical protein [Acetobacteraceae bacterium]